MTPYESMQGLNPEAYQQGLDVRKRLAFVPRFTPLQVARFLAIIGKREAEYLVPVHSLPDEAKEELGRNKEELSARRGVIPSRPNLAAHKILQSVYVPLLTSSLQFYHDSKLPKLVFISYYDYASGIMEVIHDVFQAEDEIRGASEKIATETVTRLEKAQDTPIPAWVTTQAFLYLLQNAQSRAKLLMQDPTGYALVHQAVEEIRQDGQHDRKERSFHRMLDYQEPRIVLAGAEFAQKAYQALYPLTQ
jgi:hypothetical protein